MTESLKNQVVAQIVRQAVSTIRFASPINTPFKARARGWVSAGGCSTTQLIYYQQDRGNIAYLTVCVLLSHNIAGCPSPLSHLPLDCRIDGEN